MKASKISTMPARSAKHLIPSEEQVAIFNQLVELVKPYSKSCDVRMHTPVQYELWTNHAFRTKSFRPKIQKGILFTGLAICRVHVGLYFYPLHINDELNKSIPHDLKDLLKGGSSFHIKKLTNILADQIKELLHMGWMDYLNRGWVKMY